MLQVPTRQCQNDIYFLACFVIIALGGTSGLMALLFLCRLQNLKTTHQCLIHSHQGTCFVKLSTITGCRKQSDQLSLCKNVYPSSTTRWALRIRSKSCLWRTLQPLLHQVQSMAICHFQTPAKNILIRVRPQKVTKTILIWVTGWLHNSPNPLHRLEMW